MLAVRKSHDRGSADHGWLKTSHTFSFAGYRDPEFMGFRSLRVINEDHVEAGQGFGTHAHDNMEIISYVLSGALQHKDSMGNGAVLKPGEFQRISAGSGITHSEFNPSSSEPVHFYQIWVVPNVRDTEPTYEQKEFSHEEKLGTLVLVASSDGRDGSLSIKQDANIYLAVLDENQIQHRLAAGRHVWVQVLTGSVMINGQELSASDGVAICDESELIFSGDSGSEFMMFDLS